MIAQALPAKPPWLRILQFPLSRLIVLGGIIFCMMAWSESRIEAFKDSPLIGVAIAVAMALVAMAVYVAWGELIERREVTELSLPGAGREWAIGGLIGVVLYAGCVLLLMVIGMYRIEGLNPLSYMIPAAAMAVTARKMAIEATMRGSALRRRSFTGGSRPSVHGGLRP